MADWSRLPEDLAASVAQRLTVCADYLRFGAVCTAWHSAAKAGRPRAFVPYLMVPSGDGDGDANARGLFSLRDGKVLHRILLPEESRHWRCVASCEGWLFVADLDANLFLFNPLSGSRVDLPGQATIRQVREVIVPEKTKKGREKEEGILFQSKNYAWRAFEMRDCYFWKACLSSPILDCHCIIMIVCTDKAKLAYARPEDKAWTHIKNTIKPHCAFTDIVFHKGRFYALNCKGLVLAIEITASGYKVAEQFSPLLNHNLGGGGQYLVFVPSGRLYLISRFTDIWSHRKKGPPYMTESFDIFELVHDEEDQQAEWVEVERLGDDCTVFVGHNSTFLIPHSEASGVCRTNCIYFTDDNSDFYRNKARGGHDNGVYSLEDESFGPHYLQKSRLIMPPPIWVTPNLS